MSASVVLIEDDDVLAKNIKKYLTRYGYQVSVAHTGARGLELIDKLRPDIVLTDQMLPDTTGIELLMQMRSADPDLAVIMMTGAGNVQTAVDAMKAGARDYLSKPVVLSELKMLLDKIDAAQKQASALSYYHDREATQSGLERIIGDSPVMRDLRKRIAQFVQAEAHLADSEPPSVLITGETGTGKELIARAFHFDGPRRNKPFVELNCAAIPGHLIEAELFGYERGAFTDAKQRKIGLVEAANGGTLFLDEIGEMDAALQSKLLTLLENRRIRRLGSTQEHDVNVRIIAATNQNLDDMVREGNFRGDLFYRLRVIQIHSPPLRERQGDIECLANFFLRLHAARYRKPQLTFSESALARLNRHSWPGNVRELRNTIEQAVILCQQPVIESEHLLIATPVNEPNADSKRTAAASLNLREQEIESLQAALREADGNVTRAARLLGLSRDTLRYRLAKYGLNERS